MNLKNVILSVYLLGLSTIAFSQTQKAFTEAAQRALETKDYYSALHYYRTALEFDTTNLDIAYAAAEAGRNFNAYKYSAEQYKKTIALDTENKYPQAQYYLAEMYQRLGQYDEAKTNYELYKSEFGAEGEYLTNRASKESEACEYAIDMKDKEAEHIKVENLGQLVNTPYSEFGAYQYEDDLYYSSLRFDNPEAKPSLTPSPQLSKLLKTNLEDSGEVLDGDINTTTSLVAHSAFNMNHTRIYYTVCAYLNSTDIRCDLYYKSIDEEGNFGTGSKLPSSINMAGSTSTQPNIGYDANSGREILYFVSDREGGQGKLDIWYSTIESGSEFGEPINLSSVNTGENEATPFFHKESNTFYFSSDGYLGIGGYDVFRSDYTENGDIVNIENMGLPVNSSFNDLYFTLNGNGDKGHISSNRIGSQYLEDMVEACCYDIYSVDIEEFDIKFNALTFNKATSDSLSKVTVRIIDVATGEEYASFTNIDGIDHEFDLKSGREYQVIAERDGYSSDTISVNTRNAKKGEDIIKKLYLEPQVITLDILTFDANTKEDLSGVTVILEDVDNPEISDIIRLNELGNDFQFELEPCRKYRVTIAKDGFEPQTLIIDTCDPNIGTNILKKIYLGVPNLNIYLPVTLYFDNDKPDQRSNKLYTLKSYSETYFPYFDKKEEFKEKYAAPLTGDMKYTASQELEIFFTERVQGEYNKLQVFLDKLLDRLRGGERFEVSIRGFTSPKAPNKYNLALGQRRVYSLRNELTDYASGSFGTFLDSGSLIVTDLSFGEELAPSQVSDSNSNVRKSIYSVEASEERKAQIVSVRKLN